ncbi:serine hydrolase domain-containing protein [Chitinophaga sedimenti]|uniref:serine hydrolase domain-containing protein n=1 Tax=Chitinophaga sedimenti TaxID=2033606 RepID=UPI00249EECA6|nr:serine hydrolase domain-containing protein [Chitinophaga sedimenti]
MAASCSKDGGGGNTPPDNNGPYTTRLPVQADVKVVDSLVKVLMDSYNVPGLSIAITRGEKLVYAKAYGLSDKEQNKKADTSDIYRIASLSKQLTSVAVMQLLDQKKDIPGRYGIWH